MLRRSRKAFPVLLILVLCAAAGFAQEDPETAEGVEALLSTIDATGPLWLKAVREEPADPDLAAFAARLADRDDIATAEVSGDEVYTVTTDGIRMRFSAPPPGVLGRGGSAAPALVPVVARGVTAAEPRCLGDQVPLGKALVIHGHHSGYHDIRPEFRNILEKAGYTVETGRGRVRDFRKMADAAITVINAHGGVETIDGVEHYSVDADYFEDPRMQLTQCYRWLKENQLAIYHRIEFDDTTFVPWPKRTYWGVTIYDTWFANNLQSMVPNSLVVLLTCHGADADTPWSVFSEKGAGGFLGFSGVVDGDFARKWGRQFLEYILGTSEDRAETSMPCHRAWCLKDAYDRLLDTPGFDRGYDWASDADYRNKGWKRALPVMNKHWEAPDNFSAAPHIDSAIISRAENKTDYVVDLWGGFGLAQECAVEVDGTAVAVESVGGGGMPLKVTIPPDVTGDLIVIDRWGRESNSVTISEFSTQIKAKYDDMMAAGDIEVEYRELVIGSRLYMGLTEELIYAGLPAYRLDEMIMYWQLQGVLPSLSPLSQGPDIREMGYPLVSGEGDWELSWEFDSRKQFGVVTMHATGQGQASGQGGDPRGDDEPSVSVGVLLKPSHGDFDEQTCDAQVILGCNVPLTLEVEGAFGGPPTEGAAGAALNTTVTFDQCDGILSAVDRQGINARWTVPEVRLTPDSCDFSKRM